MTKTIDTNGKNSEQIGLFSGGKDSLVACLVSKVNKVLYCRTGVGLNEEYVKDMCKRFGWELIIVEPAKHETFEKFVERFGFPHSGMHSAVMGFLKWHPMRKWHNEQKKLGRDILFISGRRKKESKRRMRMKSNKEYAETEGMKFYSPIYNWTNEQVWEYLKDNNIQRSPIYDTMHISGDCFCGAFSAKGESVAMSMFHPKLAEWIRSLEKKYGSKWGNQMSMTNAKEQGTLEDFICSECQI